MPVINVPGIGDVFADGFAEEQTMQRILAVLQNQADPGPNQATGFAAQTRQTQNKRIKNMLSDRFENDLIIRKNNVKKLSRQQLDKQEEYNYNTEYELNLSKYKFGTQSEKEFYRNKIFSNQESRSLYLNDSKLTKQQSLDSINKDLFDVDFNNFIDTKNFGSALQMIKNFEKTKFLTNDQRSKYFDQLEKESQKSYKTENIKDALLNNRAWLFDSKDRNEGVSALAETGQYDDGKLSQISISNNATYDVHKNTLAAGFSNAATTGNPSVVRAGYETYKLYKQQGGLPYLKNGMKLTDEQLDFYSTIDFMVDTMGLDIRSVMTDYGIYYKNRNNPDVKSIIPNATKVKSTANSIAENFFTDDADNVDEIESLVRRYSTILLRIRPTDQDQIMSQVQKQIESNFKVDAFGQLTAIKPHRPDTHDVSLKAYIKYLYDNGRINKDINDLDDLIAVDIDPTSTTSISGVRIINKRFPTTPVLFKSAEGDFDANEFEIGIFTDKQLEQVVYPFGKDARWESWKARQNARKLEQDQLQAEIIASKTGILLPIED